MKNDSPFYRFPTMDEAIRRAVLMRDAYKKIMR